MVLPVTSTPSRAPPTPVSDWQTLDDVVRSCDARVRLRANDADLQQYYNDAAEEVIQHVVSKGLDTKAFNHIGLYHYFDLPSPSRPSHRDINWGCFDRNGLDCVLFYSDLSVTAPRPTAEPRCCKITMTLGCHIFDSRVHMEQWDTWERRNGNLARKNHYQDITLRVFDEQYGTYVTPGLTGDEAPETMADIIRGDTHGPNHSAFFEEYRYIGYVHRGGPRVKIQVLDLNHVTLEFMPHGASGLLPDDEFAGEVRDDDGSGSDDDVFDNWVCTPCTSGRDGRTALDGCIAAGQVKHDPEGVCRECRTGS